MRAMGHHVLLTAPPTDGGSASTDMGTPTTSLPFPPSPIQLSNSLFLFRAGNVSYAVPGFHGMFHIPAVSGNHTPQFTKGAGSEEGYKRAIECAGGMAVVACEFLEDEGFARKVRRDFEGV